MTAYDKFNDVLSNLLKLKRIEILTKTSISFSIKFEQLEELILVLKQLGFRKLPRKNADLYSFVNNARKLKTKAKVSGDTLNVTTIELNCD